MKHCWMCDQWKNESLFHKDRNRRDGLNPICKECGRRNTRNHKTYDKTRKYELETHYGITIEEYNNILVSQNNCCDICGKSIENSPKKFHIDHDHKTGKNRGILCSTCNMNLGKVELGILKREPFYSKAIAYLIKYDTVVNSQESGPL